MVCYIYLKLIKFYMLNINITNKHMIVIDNNKFIYFIYFQRQFKNLGIICIYK